MIARILAPALFLIAMTLAAPVAVADLSVATPAGWTRQDDPQRRIIFLRPPDAASLNDAALAIFPAVDFAGTPGQFHSQTLARALANSRQLEAVWHGTSGAFLVSVAHCQNPQGEVLRIVLYTACWGGHAQAVLFTAARDELFRADEPAATQAVANVSVPTGSSLQPAAVVSAPPPATAQSAPDSAAAPADNPPATAPEDVNSVPLLNYNEPANFYRGASKNPYEYSSSDVNYTLCVYKFRPFEGDIAATFQQTLLREWIEPMYREQGLSRPPEFSTNTMPGASAVYQARFHEKLIGAENERMRILVVVGHMAAIVDMKAPNNFCWMKAGASVQPMLASLHVDRKPAGPSFASPPSPEVAAMAGLYAGTKPKYMAYGFVDFTSHVQALHFYLFSADGRVFRCYDNPPAGGDWRQFDFDSAQRDDPVNSGRFTVRDHQLHIQLGGAKADEFDVTVDDPNLLVIDTVKYVRR